jgi:hypothetical protein
VVVIVGMPSGNGRYLRIRDGRCRREPDIVDRAVDVAFGRIADLQGARREGPESVSEPPFDRGA